MKNYYKKDMPFSEYLKIKAVSKSSLTDLMKSPGHYYQRHIARTIDFKPTENMKLGTAMHTALLEPDLYDKEIVRMPKFKVKSKTNPLGVVEARALFLEEADKEGVTVISREQEKAVKYAKTAILTNLSARKYIDMKGDAEISMVWEDNETGLTCKGRIDKLCAGNILVDYKTTVDASPQGFAKQIANFNYHIQAASYMHGYQQVFGVKPEKFVFIAQEMTWPYLSGVYVLDADSLRSGKISYFELLRELSMRIENNDWPTACCHAEGELVIRIPQWSMKQSINL